MDSTNKKELILMMQEVGQRIGVNAVKDFLDSHSLDVDDIELAFLVKDKSKVNWKPKSKFVKLYISELDELMEKQVIDLELLGFLTLLSSYLNYEDNSLINKDGSYLTQKEIINITKWNKNKVNKTIKILIENEILYEQKQEEDKRKSKYYMNPNLFFKGQKIDKEVKEYYKQKK